MRTAARFSCPSGPRTRPSLAAVEAAERAMAVEELVQQALENVETLHVEPAPAYVGA